ncbi:MAG: NUDIX domain-containing protein [Zoogloeaceae bacterium]|nr:NUDIX domain-containing protein [Rhodocyclaceae bacterium]MCP5237473.1 NUDIX domain-containing protein [Zoogloeaceae bacterium]
MPSRHHAIPTGVHLILRRDDRVLLMRRANTGFFDGLFSLPGGHVEAGESIAMTAIREGREELGIELAEASLATVGVIHRLSDSNRIDFFVEVERWAPEPRRAEPDKCDLLDWYPEHALPAPLVPYVRLALARRGAAGWILEQGWPSVSMSPRQAVPTSAASPSAAKALQKRISRG